MSPGQIAESQPSDVPRRPTGGLVLKLALLAITIGVAYSLGYWQNRPSADAEVPVSVPPAGYVGFDPLEIDLGQHPWYTEIPFTATFVNQGAEPISVASVNSSCGCAVLDRASYEDAVVSCGAALELTGTLTVGPIPGEHRKKISVLLSSGAIRTVFLKYVSFNTYASKPRNVQFGEVNLDDDTDDALARVIFTSDTASIVGEPVVDSPWLEVGVHDRGNGETEIAVHVAKRNLPYGKSLGRVTFTTTDRMRPSFTVLAYAQGVSRLRPVPSHVLLRVGQPGEVRFITREGMVARIASVSSDDEGIDVVVDEDGEAVSVTLNVDVLPNAAVVRVTDQRGVRSKFLVSSVR
ncbi:MAG TPA: DUF1573 domain-containing protein [Phycisphaerae bacterium]|nr:DUF1573 domain-containing protein [Phycisphaerae bacterium]